MLIRKAKGVAALFLAATLVIVVPARGQSVNAEFDLRLAAGEVDADLLVGETLGLEIFVRLSSDDPIPDVAGWALFLDIDESEDDIISFDGASFSLSDSDFMLNPPCGTDNSAHSGDFGRSALAGFGKEINWGTDWVSLASFSVEALNPGSATYSFAAAPPQRYWRVDFVDFTQANVSQFQSPPTITVSSVPEPGIGALVLTACTIIGLGRRGWRWR